MDSVVSPTKTSPILSGNRLWRHPVSERHKRESRLLLQSKAGKGGISLCEKGKGAAVRTASLIRARHLVCSNLVNDDQVYTSAISIRLMTEAQLLRLLSAAFC